MKLTYKNDTVTEFTVTSATDIISTHPVSSTTGAWSKPSRLSSFNASCIVTPGLTVTGELSFNALTG